MDSYIDWINLLRPRGLPANWNPTKWSPCRADSNITSGLQSNYQGRKYSNIRFSNDKLWFDVFSFIIHSKNYKKCKSVEIIGLLICLTAITHLYTYSWIPLQLPLFFLYKLWLYIAYILGIFLAQMIL